MDDDLNIGIALASLFDFVREINNLLDANMVSKDEAAEVGGLMMSLDEVLGVIGKVEVEEALPATLMLWCRNVKKPVKPKTGKKPTPSEHNSKPWASCLRIQHRACGGIKRKLKRFFR